ncbi:DNA repair protein RadA [Candidatus Falkowbacteria bacterium RIFOXYB2_FULL_34_18]|uniref:DNA repair protein RadA n=1 Tax=Candidatus Falkowbacteria bacterium RIFOXYD2_FULL_34_120 TaxID=1798007 RepID=A0A1F5TR88_9BACT|nr:MAG: DNA repair protein RadA [Candidatus Falkowbacteria bacterium RIFOXYB2_FULL_34_18]OGF30005.1 MAG: DNA repair protein RadA [Candidatus Falkowbacteria bacterium RIFOXYC12_FULL_34_55]OGF37138.1 MAG: DNA repair protein RadA [Candidatus Falkowbacteria bacterium RIFOXYC2_FULL_34_220]OGF39541.1 MAG: DNA repair protein RadA [Candidatus Falkowbacteria bacterium RIFOXYD12_FULL_34_57]OGF41476.1 MAG: DNA repair protein RadA [Candidatus Falkowbacteria bacterium RIFOXYD2_FULL_34_120]
MKKIQTIYSCSNCGAQFFKWNGRCLECGGWGTLKEDVQDERKREDKNIKPSDLVSLADISNNFTESTEERMKTNISEIDRVFGGGIIPGSMILLSGEPGIGKSTILAQITDLIAQNYKSDTGVIYCSGEESAAQVGNRMKRLGCMGKGVFFVNETNAEKIISTIKKHIPGMVIMDSIQTMYSLEVAGEPGGINQIRACTMKFLEVAKKNDITIVLVGHITKDGTVAGPKLMEHMVDVVALLESEKSHDFRILRTTKNRFGSINEVGIFEMTGTGFREIKNPSQIFLESKNNNISGSAVSCIMEGARPFLVEVQALVTKTIFGYPQRKASGFDLNRLQVLTAVLTKRAGINLSNQDVILNVVGGLKINDPGLDLAVCMAVASSFFNKPIKHKTVIIGEVGLGGEIRNTGKVAEKLKEAVKLGFETAIIPDIKLNSKNINLNNNKNLSDAINFIK